MNWFSHTTFTRSKDGHRQVELDLADLAEAFESIEDPRSEVNRLHPLVSVLLIAVMAVLSGAGGPTAIARRANMKSEWLLRLLPLLSLWKVKMFVAGVVFSLLGIYATSVMTFGNHPVVWQGRVFGPACLISGPVILWIAFRS